MLSEYLEKELKKRCPGKGDDNCEDSVLYAMIAERRAKLAEEYDRREYRDDPLSKYGVILLTEIELLRGELE